MTTSCKPTDHPKAGWRINNYILESRIGAGSFGTVWKAKHHVFQNVVAIKIPCDARSISPVRPEGIAIHGLHHPNIVQTIDMDPDATPSYLIMEYVEGPSLAELVEAHRDGLNVQVIHQILRGMLSALEYAHRARVIHCDLKPANILLGIGSKGAASIQARHVKIADFGLGRVCGITTASMEQSGSRLMKGSSGISGTPAYMAPEQREGLECDSRCDLYSLGVVLFEMLTGKRPAGHEMPSDLQPGIPAVFDEIFKGCYCRLERRYPSATAVLHDLDMEWSENQRHVAMMDDDTDATELRKKLCPTCDGVVPNGDCFCIHCGTPLVRDFGAAPKLSDVC